MKKDHKILINDFDRQESYNEFYSSISVLFRIASFIFLMAFLVMVVYVSFDSQTSFNSANLDYVFRNYTLILDEKRNDTVYSIKYNPDSSRTFASIGNGFALCGNSGVQLFSSTGRTTCTDSLKFKNPIMVSSDKYALIYDSGNYELAVYNAFSQTLNTIETQITLKTLLDVGAGTGAATLAVANQINLDKITCVEREDAMLNLGKILLEVSNKKEAVIKVEADKTNQENCKKTPVILTEKENIQTILKFVPLCFMGL